MASNSTNKPLNYTTTIAPIKTVGEIQAILAKHGASNISIDFHNGEPVAVMFSLEINGQFPSYRLPSNPNGVLQAMKRAKLSNKYCTAEHASRVSWRVVKDWLEAQLAIIQSQQIAVYQAYLPFMVNPHTGKTLAETIEERGILALMPSSD